MAMNNNNNILPLEEIPGLLQTIEAQNGSRPLFLCKKKLFEADVLHNLNRLLVKEHGNLMDFLRDEERTAVIDLDGIELIGIDKEGELFELRLTAWRSMNMIVINRGWNTIISANNAKRGDFVEIWGYRVNNDELRLVFNFRDGWFDQ